METLIEGVQALGANTGRIVMMLIGCILMYLGIKKKFRAHVVVPMGLGTILVNIPGSGVLSIDGAAGPLPRCCSMRASRPSSSRCCCSSASAP